MSMTMTMNMFLLPCNTYVKDTTNHIHKNSSSLLSFGTKFIKITHGKRGWKPWLMCPNICYTRLLSNGARKMKKSDKEKNKQTNKQNNSAVCTPLSSLLSHNQ